MYALFVAKIPLRDRCGVPNVAVPLKRVGKPAATAARFLIRLISITNKELKIDRY
jgi:hypothetical protein